MTTESHPTTMGLDEAAALLDLPPAGVLGLVASGFLARAGGSPEWPHFNLSDVKAFLARNADNGAGGDLLHRALAAVEVGSGPGQGGVVGVAGPGAGAGAGAGSGGVLGAEELIDLLDSRAEEMATRVFKIFSTVFPEADTWPERKQGAFVRQAKGRFEAILAVTELGADVDDALFQDLRAIGSSAAASGTPLPQLLIILRISRDLLIQNAVELAGGAGSAGGRQGNYALSLLLTRILPAMDRLTDALAQGYWETGPAPAA